MIKRLAILCLFMTGCGLYWGGDDDDDICNGTAAGTNIPAEGYRDPQTGTCQYFGGGGGGCCYDNNGNEACAEPGVALPNWGQCNSQCDNLDENSCVETTGCHAAYLDLGLDAFAPATKFYGCWATAQSYDALPPTSCTGLDAQTCSERDYCSMVYSGDSAPQKFEQCIDESTTGCGIDIGCPMGSHCEQECEPCDSMGCQDTCTPTCVPDPGTGQCTGQITCSSGPPSCPANTTPGIANGCWTGYCIPNAACGSPDPGDCYDTVTCNLAPPSCPSGTLPGITNGCWSGYCIPTGSCGLAACDLLGTEAACEARSDCLAIYTGTDCTCTMTGGCTCATETYSKCESAMMPL
jgi:hypothetical protein